MALALKERRLSDLSDIQVRFLVGTSSRVSHCQILVVEYVGAYPPGSEGNEDAIYMCAVAKAGVVAFEPAGVIHDLSQLRYEWGDLLEMVFGIGPAKPVEVIKAIFGKSPSAAQPAVVVGADCEEAVRTLLLGENSVDPIEKVGWVFRNRESAWDFIENQLAPA